MYALPPQFPRDPFRAGDADALGITAKMLVGRRFQRIVHGSHLLADVQVTAELVLQALKRLHPEAVLSCMSAAKLYDRRLDAPPRPHISAPTHIRRAGLVAHQRPSVETTCWRGIGLTTPRQTFLDLATELDDVALAVVGDALCRRTALTPDELRRFVESHRPVAGLRRAEWRRSSAPAWTRSWRHECG